MSDQYIPSSDSEFKRLTERFVKFISPNPSAYFLTSDDVAELVAVSDRFAAAQMKSAIRQHRSPAVTAEKKAARTEAEKIIRKLAKLIRANDKIALHDRIELGLHEPIARGKKKAFPKTPPMLRFVRAHHESNSATPVHELAFYEMTEEAVIRKSRPDGAARLELFVGLIPPDAEVPNHPGDMMGRGAWYLRSYTRSPITVEPPIAKVPMRVVYWARWADSAGKVGPICKPAIGWIEGGNVSRRSMRVGEEPKKIDVDARKELVDERTYSVAVIEAHYLSFTPNHVEVENPKLEVTVIKEPKQIEGPVESEAA